MNDVSEFEESLSVGVVQTTLDAGLAWQKNFHTPTMSPGQDAHAWHEICRAVRSFKDDGESPRVIVFPELSLPRTRLNEFDRLIAGINAIAIAGVDYKCDNKARAASNEGIVFIPNNFWYPRPSTRCNRVVFGKTHPAPAEKRKLSELNPSWTYRGDDNVYVFDAEKYGKIGVSICYDFMDLERAVMYRGRIHHLIVLAYNRDLGTFKALAEALSRTVFCNVIVCNTGHYGGSTAIAPYHEAHRRTLYAHGGMRLFTSQVIKLPLMRLSAESNGSISGKAEFKDPPPGFKSKIKLKRVSKSLKNL